MSDLGLQGGDQLRKHLQEIVERLGVNPSVEVGFMENSTCGINNDASAPTVAFYNEYGTTNADGSQHIPPRPFFRATIDRQSPTWGRLVGAALKLNNYDVNAAFDLTGQKMVSQIQLQIEETTEPPNADSTVNGFGPWNGKGFNKPLEHSKNMKRAVSHRVIS